MISFSNGTKAVNILVDRSSCALSPVEISKQLRIAVYNTINRHFDPKAEKKLFAQSLWDQNVKHNSAVNTANSGALAT